MTQKKMGRPTDDKKERGYRLRMSDTDLKRLDVCCELLGLTKAEVIRQGINEMYEKAQNKKK